MMAPRRMGHRMVPLATVTITTTRTNTNTTPLHLNTTARHPQVTKNIHLIQVTRNTAHPPPMVTRNTAAPLANIAPVLASIRNTAVAPVLETIRNTAAVPARGRRSIVLVPLVIGNTTVALLMVTRNTLLHRGKRSIRPHLHPPNTSIPAPNIKVGL